MMPADQLASSTPTIRSLAWSVYVPSALLALGMTAVMPLVALTARDLGASVAVAGAIVSANAVGALIFDLPAGRLVGTIGERRSMIGAVVVLAGSLIGAIVSTSPWTFALSMGVLGCAWAVWLLSRQAYVTEVMPPHRRGRALSSLGGAMRVGSFVGPFAGSVAVTVGGFDAVYATFLAMAVLTFVLLLSVPDRHADKIPDPVTVPYGRVVVEHHRTFLTAGSATLVLSMLRISRSAIIPLWAEHIGLEDAQVGIIFGLGSAIDMTLFYVAGTLSDRYGRKAVAIPSLSLLALGFALLPLTGSFTTLVLVALLQGFGNGLGSGLIMTLGSDLSPDEGRASFLGVWRTIGDTGRVGGPLVVAAVVSAASLAPASVLVAVVGFAGAGLVAAAVPEPRRTHSDR